jgi:hypothetical protein
MTGTLGARMAALDAERFVGLRRELQRLEGCSRPASSAARSDTTSKRYTACN